MTKKLTNKQYFLKMIQEMNTYFEEKISKEDAIRLYDGEIAPYGYPSHQKFMLYQAATLSAYNDNIRSGQYKKYFKNPPTLGQGFSNVLTDNHYITDALAHSLFNTDAPNDFKFIKRVMSLDVLPVITVVFSNDFDLGEDVCANVRRIDICKKDIGISVQVHSGKLAGQIQYDFFIPIAENDCCQLCATKEFFIDNELGYRVLFKALAFDIKKDDVKKEIFEKFEYGISAFQNETLPKMYRFVINLLCLMTQEPEIVTIQKPKSKYRTTNSKGFSAEKINNVPNVKWLGADFTTRTIQSNQEDKDPSDRTAGSPKRSHWRRGHWHTISQGPKRVQKKLKWFQPVFIKGHKQINIKEEV